MFGHAGQEALGKQMHALLAPERYHEAFRKGFSGFAKTGQGPVVGKTVELEAIRKDGTEFPIEVFLSAVQLNSQWHAVGIVRDVSERKRAEEALRQSEENYRELADSITDVFFAMNRDLRYIYWNKASEELTGIKAEQAIDKSIFEVFPDTGDTRRAAAIYEEVLKTGQRQNFEQKYQLGGEDFSFEISAYPSARGLSVFVKDITERKQAEQALQESEQKFRLITNAAQDPIIMVDDEGRISYWNRAAEEVFGYTSQEAIGREYAHFVSAEYHEAYRQAFDEFARDGRGDAVGRTIELDMIRKDGMRFPAEISTATVQIGGRWHAVGIVRDISQRKRSQEALRMKEAAIAVSQNAIGFADLEGNLIYVNESFLRLYGCDNESEVLGRQGTEMWTSVEEAQRLLIQLRKDGKCEGELAAQRKDGSLVNVLLSATMVTDEKGKPLCMMASGKDITQRKQAEDALQKRTHDLGERIKELNCLYAMSKLVEKPDTSLDEIIQGTVDLIPPAWQYPEITCAQITLEGKEFRTKKFNETRWKQIADIKVRGQRVGSVAVLYLEERPESAEGPFLKEEKDLITAIAEGLGRIIQRRWAEESLRESEERYRILFNSGRDLVFVTDMTREGMPGRIIEVNDFACQRLGYTREELCNLSGLDLACLDELDGYRPLVGKLLADRELIFETVALAKDGTEIPIEISAHIFDLKGRPLLLSIARDITRRHRAEEALQETEEKYRKFTERRGW